MEKVFIYVNLSIILRSNNNGYISIYVTFYHFVRDIKRHYFEIPSRDFKSIKIDDNIGFQALH